MNFSFPIHARDLLGMLAVLAMCAFPAPSGARDTLSDAFNISEEDLAMLPPYCAAKITRATDKALQEYWGKRFGASNWVHMHHYCFGLKAMQLAYRDYANEHMRMFQAGVAIDNFSYMIKFVEPGFFMRPELLMQRGRALTLKREYEDAESDYRLALKINKKYVDAWAALSDLYAQVGKNDEAIKVLTQAIEETGEEHKKFTSRLHDLRQKVAR